MLGPRKGLIHLDGRTLEGGGQIVRNAVALSSLARIPIHITNIRGGRGPNGKNGGLKPAHLAAVQWLAQATAADAEGLELKSGELKFQPPLDEEEQVGHSKVWRPCYKDNKITRLESTISLNSPGAITLILQAVLPYILLGCSKTPIWLTINGGTNASSSPSIDYFEHVFFPALKHALNIEPIETIIHRRGWTIGRLEVGSVTFKIIPVSTPLDLLSFHSGPRGTLNRVKCRILSAGGIIRHVIEQTLEKELRTIIAPTVQMSIEWQDSCHERRIYILLIAEMSGCCSLASDCLYDMHRRNGRSKTKGGSQNAEIADKIAGLVSGVVKDLENELSVANSCFDQYLQDQIVVFQCLTQGTAKIKANAEPTLHTKTARWVGETVLGIKFDELGDTIGIGSRDGSRAKFEDKEAHIVVTSQNSQDDPLGVQ